MRNQGTSSSCELPVEKAGKYTLELVLTQARDYGIVQLSLDGRTLGGPIDLFNNPEVITTGVLDFDGIELEKGAATSSASKSSAPIPSR